MTNECRHVRDVRYEPGADGARVVARCVRCRILIGVPCVDADGRGLPDAAITPAVAIEIRAAALAGEDDWGKWSIDRLVSSFDTVAEDRDWYLSGWLAARIAMHDEEQR